MGLEIVVGNSSYVIGSPSFLNSFFSTVYVRLEKRWGTQYPILMNELYSGKLAHEHCDRAINELVDIRRRLADFSPDQVVWDFEDRSARPPWGDQISPNITSLANYFWTADGKDLIDVLLAAFGESKNKQKDALIQ